MVNTASIAGLIAAPFLGPYNATKQAVVAISETLYKDLQAVGAPVGVSVLCPGFVQTRIAESERNRPPWAPEPRRRQGRPSCAAPCRAWSTAASPRRRWPTASSTPSAPTPSTSSRTPSSTTPSRTRFDDIMEGRPPSPTMIA